MNTVPQKKRRQGVLRVERQEVPTTVVIAEIER